MSSSTRSRLRAHLISATTATALATALVAVPAGGADATTATPSPSVAAQPASWQQPAASRPRLVTLLTGDRVLVRHDAQGRTIASLTPHSPHYGRPVEFVHTSTHTYVVPRLSRDVRAHFDTSVFDVASLSGRVPLSVTYAAGATPRSMPGLRLLTTRRTASGRTVARATYDASKPLPASFASSLRGVSRISLAAPTPQLAPAYELHTLTIDATNARGNPLGYGDVLVFNADDGALMNTFGAIFDGQWKVSVPDGDYLVVVSTFGRVVVDQVTVSGGDVVSDVSMAEASVKPAMTAMKGLMSLSPGLDIVGTDDAGHGGFDFGWSGIFPRVTAVPNVTAGHLATSLSNLWTTKGYQPFTFTHGQERINPIKRVVAAKEYADGIPSRLTYHYHAGDFANVAIRHYATGPRQSSFDSWVGIAPTDLGFFVEGFPTTRPGVVHASFLGSRTVVWDSSTAVSDDFRAFTELDQTARYHRGQRATVPFFRGPVTPVADRGGQSRRVDYSCRLCVIDGQLGGFLSMFASAGTDQFGLTSTGRFALYRGRHLVSHGDTFLAPYVKAVKPGQRMRLVVTTTPANRKYVLSRNVTDTFRFAVPAKRKAIVPLLRAAYVPPTNLHSVGVAGRTSYPITFDNLGPVAARITDAAVRWSVDGRHWHAAHLTRRDKNTFGVAYRNPVGTKAHPYLSLKVTARDVAGRSISEYVEHAYVLPHGSLGTSQPAPAQHRNVFRPSKLCRTSGERSYSCYVKLSRATLAAGKASPDPAGWGAPALRSAYDLGADSGTPGTVAVVVAFDYPHAEADLNHYRAQYGLPACTSADGCFTKVNQAGEEGNYPQQDYGWGIEASLDLQMVSAACPTCHIVLVEADEPSDEAFFAAEQTAVDAGATVINHSWGRIELTGAETDATHFVHPGVTDVASTGDFGYQPAQFPASSPDVIAVGGTVISRSATAARGWNEKAWSFAGSGCSAYFAKPAGQDDPACHGRTLADVSAVAHGLAIYNTSLPRHYRGWMRVDGTSASSPLVAGMVGSAGALGVRPADLYAAYASTPSLVNDVVGGSNGYCRDSYICTGVTGYDGPSGLGSPAGTTLFTP